MNRIFTTVIRVFLLTFCAAPITGMVSAADIQHHPIDAHGLEHQVDIEVGDVTAQCATGLDGTSRANGDHWFFNYGGTPDYDYVMDMIVTADGGSAVAGYRWNATSGFNDAHLLRYDADGNLVWASGLNLGGHDTYAAVCELTDGTLAAVGQTEVLGEEEPRLLLVRYNSNGTIQWAHLAGNSGAIYPRGICLTTDDTLAVGADGFGYGPGSLDVLLLEFDLTGDLVQTTVVGDSGNDILRTFSATSDGGFIATGWSSSFATHTHGLLIKFADTSTVSWTTVVGDDIGYSYLFDAVETPDGDFFASGATEDYDPGGSKDVLVARVGADGTLGWARTLGDAGVDELGNSLALREGGGFMVLGESDAGGWAEDVLLIDFDDAGGLQWVRILGEDGFERAAEVQNLPGGGYLLAGTRTPYGTGEQDAILAAVDSDGLIPGCPHIRTWYTFSPLQTPAWSAVTLAVSTATLGVQAGSTTPVDPNVTWSSLCDYETPESEYWLVASAIGDDDRGQAIGGTPDGGYWVAVESDAGAGNVDVLLLKYDARGDLEDLTVAGGPLYDQPRDLVVTEDGGCIVVGHTYSYGSGASDAMIMGFDSSGSLNWTTVLGGASAEWLHSIHRRSDGNYLAVGATNSYGEGLFDLLVIEVTPVGTVPSIHAIGSQINEIGLRGIPLSGGGSLIAGQSFAEGDDQDAIAVRIGDDGSFTWCSRSGTAGDETFTGAVELPGGDLLLGGYTDSYGSFDGLLVRLGPTGARHYFRTTGTAEDEYLYDLAPTEDGGVAGCGLITQSPAGYFDGLLCRFDDQAQPVWVNRVTGAATDRFDSLVANGDGGFSAAGFSGSFGPSGFSVLAARTDADGWVDDCYLFGSYAFTTSDQFPPAGAYTMTSTAISPSISSPTVEYWGAEPWHQILCHALPPTVSACITAVPSAGTVPFSTWMEVSLVNNYGEQVRRMAARVNVTLGNGSYYPSWRAGFTNLAPGEISTTGWTQNIPALATVIGENRFQLVAEDVTPPPYNFPPYPPAGDTDTGQQTVTAFSP